MKHIVPNLVYIDEHGLLGSNFYYRKYADKGLSKADIDSVGLTSDRVQVSAIILAPLKKIDEVVRAQGYCLYIKEGYRSKDLYEIMYRRRCEKFGQEETDRLVNIKDMPHANGTTVDVALWNVQENKEVYMRNSADGIDALFIDFYKNKTDESSKKYQTLQDFLVGTMLAHGFEIGVKREYFHFNYIN